MIPGLSGSMLSHDAVSRAAAPVQPAAVHAHRGVRAWHAAVRRELGPASSARTVFDRVAVQLGTSLGFSVAPVPSDSGRSFRAVLQAHGTVVATLLATEWGRDPAAAWRETVVHAIGAGVRWCMCVTGPLLRIFDARRTYSRRFAQFDLEIALNDPTGFAVFWWLLSADAFTDPRAGLERAVLLSDRHRAEVRASLQEGVREALAALIRAFDSARRPGRTPRDPGVLFEESLVVIYRILFLLFAEARGLVPGWHPIYRDSYTIESLRPVVETLAKPPGLWRTLQAIARLAHGGCRAGSLKVPPFNGRLFSPVHAPLAESLDLDDGAVREAVMSLTTRTSAAGRQRIAYGDLGVEQLGGVYERVLDYEPQREVNRPAAITLIRAGRRKATGTFYTPRALTEFMVRRALAPLVKDAGAPDILSLRVLDPAMGSGAFLVAACRYLAAVYESALIRDGVLTPSDVSEAERAGFRRTVAQRCLFGVDINPMAVQLGRLSLWLATLARDRPLTFLDHHLRAGNSLVGASLENVLQRRPGRRRSRSARDLPLFELDGADAAMRATVGPRLSLARDPGDTIEQIRAKERLLSSLRQISSPLSGWTRVADLWTAEWFRSAPSCHRGMFDALVDEALGRPATLPRHVSAPLFEEAAAIARRERFFHWSLEFPEVFHDETGRPLLNPGFDVVLGNPPWEMLRGDRGATRDSAALTSFARGSGLYVSQGQGHVNLYQLFLERAIALARSGGRIAMVLPSGYAVDHGCSRLRRELLDRTDVDTFISIENRDGLFPIHRGLKFLLVTATRGGATATLPCRFGVRSPDALDALPDSRDPGTVPLPKSLIEACSGEQFVIPELRSPIDAAILSRCAFTIPALSSPDGWRITFGRELNATDDREHINPGPAPAGSLPIVEGKHLQPFTVDVAASSCHIAARTAARVLGRSAAFTRPRLAYRDVASPTNRMTLIAAVVPAGVVTTHTLFCLKGHLDADTQLFICGVFNSFVANYLVRARVGTHVTVSIIDRLPVPKPAAGSAAFRTIVALSARLAIDPTDSSGAAALHASVAHLYGLSRGEFQHVLDTFPLIPSSDRAAAMHQFVSTDAAPDRRYDA
jgi:hypothetical protein